MAASSAAPATTFAGGVASPHPTARVDPGTVDALRRALLDGEGEAA
jgi:hypothetical protein